MRKIMIYGATGYTGALAARQAVAVGLDPILAGRSMTRLAPIAEELGCEKTAFAVTDNAAAREALADVEAVLNCAGPFADTWEHMTRACLDTRTHYLDITGEPDVLAGCASLDEAAKGVGITILPGVGFDVVPTDCMAAMLVERLPDAQEITLAFRGVGQASRGTATTGARHLATPPQVRRNGRIEARQGPLSTEVDFGQGPEEVMAVSWGDIVTAAHTTGVQNIEVFFQPPPATVALLRLPRVVKWFLSTPFGKPIVNAQLRKMPDGPDAEARATGRARIYGRAVNGAGEVVELRLETMEPYELTSITAPMFAQAAADGRLPTGFQTPARALGSEFVLTLDKSRMIG
ncbi:trans-acting enoyl reductase family protein [Maritimibacter sp. DP1N21-5]|uniref:saccharopine dehydrogenase family protein n=1 Tax=Maritimibacter sp. DP1N21-5 TaxID=2836867 RepID=UPI001C47F6ED|nr:saccharopine dehydrogenase NADP-binding domain-containing protein [Maritimibacter sp. DP1N21-5]MBV7407784.1 saccharopine dehydrogenase NADP-binding domain-containing protein [Maritimibacter sp. DP1N21-5]